MSGGKACKCDRKYLVVVQRNLNHSAFNGYKPTYSRYSEVGCKLCGTRWRTIARYVDSLPDLHTQGVLFSSGLSLDETRARFPVGTRGRFVEGTQVVTVTGHESEKRPSIRYEATRPNGMKDAGIIFVGNWMPVCGSCFADKAPGGCTCEDQI